MKKHFLFTAALFAALSFGFVSCENPDDSDLLQQIEDLKSELMDVKDMLSDADKDKDKGSDKDEKPSSDSGDKEDTETPVSCFTPAAFSVSADKQVCFSPANLQYIRSSDTWQFASCQWECVGPDNVIGGVVTYDEKYGYTISRNGTALADKVDLFGWSTGATNFGVSTSTDNDDYSGSFVDWGTNQIGDDVPNTWRTLTYDEWSYLLGSRTNASSLRGIAEVNGVNGLILLPDDWSCPAGVAFRRGFFSYNGTKRYCSESQKFTAAQWSKMETAGAVFLPAAGHRNGSDVNGVQYYGCYWSATEYTSYGAGYFEFDSCGADMSFNYNREYGYSVRLVKDL